MQRYEHPFDPILFSDTETLILGTFPSLDSFRYDFYYAHKRNQFWKILSQIFGMPARTHAERIALLQHARIGLWDIVASCERRNSADSNLKKCTLHDIPALLARHPSIRQIAFTGKKAAALYMRQYSDLPVETVTLPSPSPAYAAMSPEAKREIYAQVLITAPTNILKI